MYIKFCRSYGEDKKDEVKENLSSKLSVELEGEKEKQPEGNARLYRVGCLILTLICLVLLLVVIFLSVKLQTGSTVCPESPTVYPERQETATETQSRTFSATCSYEQCQVLYPNIQPKRLGCQQCADGWLTYGRSCFYLSTFRLSWDESQRNCTARGGSLAVITSQNVQNFLAKEGNLRYWIGLRNKGNTWTWVNDTVMLLSYWAENESEGNCGILDTSKTNSLPPEKNWVRTACQARTYFICQVQL